MLNLLQEETNGDYYISTDKQKIDVAAVFDYLSNQSYWAKGIPIAIVKRSIDNSMCFGVYEKSSNKQIGFARMITDHATFAYLADVYILEGHRKKGLSKWLMHFIMNHPELQGLRRIMLATRDAHGLYKQFGFTSSKTPENLMEIRIPDIYLTNP